MYSAKRGTADLTLWYDGPKLDKGGAGAANVRKNDATSRDRQEQKASLGENNDILDAELWGILEALKVARRKARNIHSSS